MPVLQKLALSTSHLRTCITTGIWGEEYGEMLRQTKMVFNHSIRKEVNMRILEAMASGTLVLVEEANIEAPKLFVPGVHYVAYSPTNMTNVIEYYLQHDQDRLTIARAGQQQVQRYSHENNLKRLAEIVQQATAFGAYGRTMIDDTAENHYSYAIMALQNFNRSIAFEHLQLARVHAPGHVRAMLVLATIHVLDYLSTGKQNHMQQAEILWNRLEKHNAEYRLLAMLNRAHSLYTLESDQANELYMQLSILLSSMTMRLGIDTPPPLLNYLSSGSAYRAQWEATLSAYAAQPTVLHQRLVLLIRHSIEYCLGSLANRNQLYELAVTHLQQAISHWPPLESHVSDMLVTSLLHLRRHEEALATVNRALAADHALSPSVWVQRVLLMYGMSRDVNGDVELAATVREAIQVLQTIRVPSMAAVVEWLQQFAMLSGQKQ